MLRMLLSALWAWLQRNTAKPTPEPELRVTQSTKRMAFDAMAALLAAQAPDANVYLSDKSYLLCNENDIAWMLANDQSNKMEFTPEALDCDDFSYRLMGQFSVPGWSDLAFGIVWTNLHALNCFIDESGSFWFVEPQTDTLQSALLPWQGSKIRLIVM